MRTLKRQIHLANIMGNHTNKYCVSGTPARWTSCFFETLNTKSNDVGDAWSLLVTAWSK